MAIKLTTENIIKKARDSLIVFSILTMSKYTPNWHHELIAEKLEAVERGEITRLMIFMPPRHGKSQLSTINFPAWYIGKNPGKEIITASYSGDLAQDFWWKTRDLISQQEYQAIFPTTQLKSDSKSKGKWQTNQRGSYTSVWVWWPITWRWADIALIDDPLKNREEADSETIRNKVWGWYTSTLYTRLETDFITWKRGAIVLILTRWHMDDLAWRLLEQMKEGGDQWDIVEFPAIADHDEEYRKSWEALWPIKYDVKALHGIRRTVWELDWSALYQQMPIMLEHATFKPSYFRYFEEVDLKGKQLEYTVTVDLAIGQQKHHDDTAIVVVGKERNSPEMYIVEILSWHFDPLQTIDALFWLYSKYRFRKCGIESVAFQKAMSFFLLDEMKKREVYFSIIELKAVGAKEKRIEGLQPLYQTWVIYHRRDYLKLESQLINFPKAAHDDLADALAYQLEMVNPTKRKFISMQAKKAVNFLTGRTF